MEYRTETRHFFKEDYVGSVWATYLRISDRITIISNPTKKSPNGFELGLTGDGARTLLRQLQAAIENMDKAHKEQASRFQKEQE